MMSQRTLLILLIVAACWCISVSSVIAAGSQRFTPAHDALVKLRYPDKNYGRQDHMRVRASRKPYRSFLRFVVSGVGNRSTSATLRLFVTNGSPSGGALYNVASFDEDSITWNTAPDIAGIPVAQSGFVSAGEWIEFDVSGVVTGDGEYAFGLMSEHRNSAFFSSKEGAAPPELLVAGDSYSPSPDPGGPVSPSPDPGGPISPSPDPGDPISPSPDPGGPVCSDGSCDIGESCTACPADCGQCPSNMGYLWISPAELSKLPTSGSAWNHLQSTADASFDRANNHGWTGNSGWDTDALAAALVAARLGLSGAGSSYRTKAADAIMVWARDPNYKDFGKMTYPARNIPAVVIAADVIDFPNFAGREADELEFRRFVANLRYECFGSQSCFQEATDRPNNKGTMALAAMAAITSYLVEHGLPSGACGSGVPSSSCAATDTGQFRMSELKTLCEDPLAELEAIAQVVKGFTGHRDVYDGFDFNTSDLKGGNDWQCDENESYLSGTGNGYGINPVGCTRSSHDIGGVIPDDQRRGGSFTWPPFKENYVYTSTQGVLVAAVILHNQGYDVWNWGNKAIKRVFDWTHNVAKFPVNDRKAGGNDGWQTYIINHYYGTNFPTASGSTGFNMAFTEWVFGER